MSVLYMSYMTIDDNQVYFIVGLNGDQCILTQTEADGERKIGVYSYCGSSGSFALSKSDSSFVNSCKNSNKD